MKTFATLALILALLGLTAVDAAAVPFTLWEYFPQTQGENGFFAASHKNDPDTLTYLIKDSVDHSFSSDGDGTAPVVQRSGTSPWIFMQPSNSESAVLFGIPPAAYSLHIYGEFDLKEGISEAHVTIGKVLWSDLSTFTPISQDILTLNHKNSSFDLTTLIDPSYALVFDVSDAPAYLQGTIESTPVPVPASVLLLGSGLLGLAGWRRRPWLK